MQNNACKEVVVEEECGFTRVNWLARKGVRATPGNALHKKVG